MGRWPQILLALAGVLVPAGVALQGWTLSYVVSIERRIARLEARDELRGWILPRPSSSSDKAHAPAAEGQRGARFLLGQPLDDHREQRLEVLIGRGVEGPAARHAEIYERLSASGGIGGPPVVAHEPGRVADLAGKALD